MALKRHSKVSGEFSSSSMSDLVFLLLIFFMMTSTLIAPNALKLLLPQSNNQTIASKPITTVSITKDLRYVEKEVEHDLTEVGPDQKLRDLVNAISHSRRNIFPVVDEEGKLMGIVMLDDIRKIMFNTEMYDTTYVYELMTMPPDIIKITDTMDIVMDKFEKSGAWNLPVVRNGLYVGYLSKSKIYTAYRKVL